MPNERTGMATLLRLTAELPECVLDRRPSTRSLFFDVRTNHKFIHSTCRYYIELYAYTANKLLSIASNAVHDEATNKLKTTLIYNVVRKFHLLNMFSEHNADMRFGSNCHTHMRVVCSILVQFQGTIRRIGSESVYFCNECNQRGRKTISYATIEQNDTQDFCQSSQPHQQIGIANTTNHIRVLCFLFSFFIYFSPLHIRGRLIRVKHYAI